MGVLEISLVGILFHARHKARMSQIDRPAGPRHQLVAQISGPRATLYRRLDAIPKARYVTRNHLPIVGTFPVSKLAPLSVQHAHLHKLLVVVQSHKNSYTSHDSLLLVKRN